MDGVYDKMLYKVHCPEFPLRLLPPYVSVNDAVFQNYLRNLRNVAPEWLPSTK
jgi:hypothetical protein